MDASTIPIVFIHGIKGSSLVDESGATWFINLWQGLGISSPALSLPLEWEGTKQKQDGLKGGKILDRVGHVQVYGPFVRYLESLNRPVYPYAYDWRRDLNETVEKFQAFLREIHAKHNSKIQLIAHSMGGLVSLASINTHNGVLIGEPVVGTHDKDNIPPSPRDPDTVATSSQASSGGGTRIIDILHSVVFAGCPFRTGVGFLSDLMVGVPNGYNHSILSPNVLFTFPSIYTFFPKKENSQILDEKGEKIPIDFYDANDWIKYKLGIFNKIDTPTPEQRAHLDKCTSQAKLLRSKVVALSDVKYPPIAVLASHKHVTLQKYKMIDGKLDFVNVITKMGDDRIINATPPDGIPYKEYETDNAHASLLNDIPTSSKIINDLLNAANKQ